MTIKKMTVIILVSVAVLLGIYDVYALVKAGGDSTISWVIWSTSKEYPVLPLVVGILCGHFFWQMKPEGK